MAVAAPGCGRALVLHGVVPPFFLAPHPLVDRADNRLAAGMDMDLLHRHLLLALAAVAMQRLYLSRVGPQDLYRQVPIGVLLRDRIRSLEWRARDPSAHCGQAALPVSAARRRLR